MSYADIFISQVRAAGSSPPQSQLPVEDVFWNATILHTMDVTQPSQSVLSKQSVGRPAGDKTSAGLTMGLMGHMPGAPGRGPPEHIFFTTT